MARKTAHLVAKSLKQSKLDAAKKNQLQQHPVRVATMPIYLACVYEDNSWTWARLCDSWRVLETWGSRVWASTFPCPFLINSCAFAVEILRGINSYYFFRIKKSSRQGGIGCILFVERLWWRHSDFDSWRNFPNEHRWKILTRCIKFAINFFKLSNTYRFE